MTEAEHFLLTTMIEPAAVTEACPDSIETEPRPIKGAQNAPELCQLVSDYDANFFPEYAIMEPKVDGWRAIALRPNRIVTREGQPLPAAGHCARALAGIERAMGQPMVFDGELVHTSGFQALQRAMRQTKPSAGIVYWLFDAVPLAEWEKGDRYSGPRDPLRVRKTKLRKAYERAMHENIGLIWSCPIQSEIEADRMAQGLWKAGHEGIVIKDSEGFYQRQRSTSWMRMKRKDTSDVVVEGFQHAESTRRAVLNCKTMEGIAFTMNVKGDAVDAVSDPRFACRIYSIIEISHSGFTSAGIPRHAQFVRVRDDKFPMMPVAEMKS